MIWLLAVGLILVLPFLVGAITGALYLPAFDKKIEIALDGLALKKGQTLIDLGSGDGKVALAAAKRGLQVIGYEINPWLCVIARLRCRRHRGVHIYWRSFWRATLPETQGVFVFGIGHIMDRLSAKLRRELPAGTRVASFAWPLPQLKNERHKSDIFFYTIA